MFLPLNKKAFSQRLKNLYMLQQFKKKKKLMFSIKSNKVKSTISKDFEKRKCFLKLHTFHLNEKQKINHRQIFNRCLINMNSYKIIFGSKHFISALNRKSISPEI